MGRKSRLGTAATRVLGVRLTEDEASTLEKLARARAVKPPDLVRSWIALAAGGVLVPAPALPGHAADTSEAGQTKWLLDLLAQVPAQGLRNLRGGRAVISAMQDLRARSVIAPEVHTRNRVGKKPPSATSKASRAPTSSPKASDAVLDQGEHDERAERVIGYVEASGKKGARVEDVLEALAGEDRAEMHRVDCVITDLVRARALVAANEILTIAPEPAAWEPPAPPSSPPCPLKWEDVEALAAAVGWVTGDVPIRKRGWLTPDAVWHSIGRVRALITSAELTRAEVYKAHGSAGTQVLDLALAYLVMHEELEIVGAQGIRKAKSFRRPAAPNLAQTAKPPKPKLKLSRWRPKTESRTADRQPPIAEAPPVAKPAPKASRRRAKTETIVGEVQTPLAFPEAVSKAPRDRAGARPSRARRPSAAPAQREALLQATPIGIYRSGQEIARAAGVAFSKARPLFNSLFMTGKIARLDATGQPVSFSRNSAAPTVMRRVECATASDLIAALHADAPGAQSRRELVAPVLEGRPVAVGDRVRAVSGAYAGRAGDVDKLTAIEGHFYVVLDPKPRERKVKRQMLDVADVRRAGPVGFDERLAQVLEREGADDRTPIPADVAEAMGAPWGLVREALPRVAGDRRLSGDVRAIASHLLVRLRAREGASDELHAWFAEGRDEVSSAAAE